MFLRWIILFKNFLFIVHTSYNAPSHPFSPFHPCITPPIHPLSLLQKYKASHGSQQSLAH